MDMTNTSDAEVSAGLIEAAREMLYPRNGETDEPAGWQAARPEELYLLAKNLSRQSLFGYARKIYSCACRHPEIGAEPELRRKAIQQQAVSTYKDVDLPLDVRLDAALAIIAQAAQLGGSIAEQQETLGITGAIHKRKWEIDNQKQHLETALTYYKRGYELTGEKVSGATGYNGINAAFIYDILAWQERESARRYGEDASRAGELSGKAREIRTRLKDKLPKEVPEAERDKWVLATLAESCFGLGDFEGAKQWLAAYKAAGPDEWERATTAQQLASVARFQSEEAELSWEQIRSSEAWRVLNEFLDNENGLLAGFAGKVGLALSGGGFRASLFHIGVLAKLAELDMLRHVEAISCVSGGSIIGAYYYMELQQLLQRKPDTAVGQLEAVSHEDYVKIVERIQEKFLEGVQSNIRTRLVANPRVNLKMLTADAYTRTDYIAELYESELFSRIEYGELGRPRHMEELKIKPLRGKGQWDESFNPKRGNWKRQAKVPILILNAATLNTGHNWQFTASWMGEPPSYINTEIDSNYRLRRLYYEQAPQTPSDHTRVGIGKAVAASSCVPGLFEPIALPFLYEGKMVRLVDGGVQDNQGVTGLLDQGCTVLLVSDASGQMGAQDEASGNRVGVLSRTNSILMSRVRESQFQELDARRKTSLLRGLMFIHLKKDLSAVPQDWIGCTEPYRAEYDARPAASTADETSYGVSKKVQEHLALIRTDLDTFSEAEAYALMTSGYLMAEHEFSEGRIKGFPPPPPLNWRPDWKFLRLRDAMKLPLETDGERQRQAKLELLKQLEVASSGALRIMKLNRGALLAGVLTALAGLASALLLGGLLVFGLYKLVLTLAALLTQRGIIVALCIAGALLLLALGSLFISRLRRPVLRFIIGLFAGTVGFLAAWVHLLIFDYWFKQNGRVSKLLG